MTFFSFHFIIFFVALLASLHICTSQRLKKKLLLIFSIIFYGYWDIRFVLLLLFLAIGNFYLGKRIDSKNSMSRKYLYGGVLLNIIVLCFFKYTNFFIDNLNIVLNKTAIYINPLNIIIPMGISFFIFELISYLIDVSREKLQHTDSFEDFLIFMFFFPRITSGPIVRPAEFLPQLGKDIKITRSNLADGLQIFCLGLFKKIVIADTLAGFVDTVYSSPSIFHSLTLLMAVIAYSIQIYCDFSGYSDMAIGIARMLGFKLPTNFNLPYISKNITEFWSRWHISLSLWLKDYLYISLGGNRKGIVRRDLNLFLTMLLGGLWHGANWTFVVWGALHGIALIVQKKFSNWKESSLIIPHRKLFDILSMCITYGFVSFSWIFFRAPSLHTAIYIIKRICVFSAGTLWIYPQLILILLIVVIATVSKVWYNRSCKPDYIILDLKTIRGFSLFFALLCGIFFLSANNTSPFIYFQF